MTIKSKDDCRTPEHYHKELCEEFNNDCVECTKNTREAIEAINDNTYYQDVEKARAKGKCHLRIVK